LRDQKRRLGAARIRSPSHRREVKWAEAIIDDVSDTALWVAVYRALETQRPDALFRDPLAERLAGDKGRHIAATMGRGSHIGWMIVARTCIIDAFIGELVSDGVDTVLNLGAGLDTRPYRLPLPSSLNWVEVDYPKIIDLKNRRLDDQQPRCRLQHIGLDLSDRSSRQKLFDTVSANAKKVAVLTEGVIPYLSNDQAGSLAEDLRAQENFRFWITDYFAPALLRLAHWSGFAKRRMKNAPIRFRPGEPHGFFIRHGWRERETRYLAIEAKKLGRPFPRSWWLHAVLAFLPKDRRKKLRGYTLLEPN
jgi:methyltransferase (TIGR00027 family)